MIGDFLATLAVVLVLILVSSQFVRRFTSDERRLLWWSFVAHQVAGIANIWVARYYYGYGDMLTYHADGVIAASWLRSSFWDLAPSLVGLIFHSTDPVQIPIEPLVTSSGAMQALSAFANFFFFDSLYATCAFIAGMAFLSKIALYSTTCAELPHLPRRALLWSCTLVPSVVFWSSSLLKEPIAMIGLLLALSGFRGWLRDENRLRSALMLLVGCTIVYIVKVYILPVFGVSAAVWYLVYRMQSRGIDVAFRVWHLLVGSAAVIAVIAITGLLLPNFALDSLRDQLAGNQTAGANIEGGSNYSLGAGSGSAASQLALAPIALLTSLFRPALFEAKTLLIFINALEVTAFTLATLWVPFRRKLSSSISELFRWPFLSFCCVFVITFGTLTALGTTNLGTLSRYRAPLVPFFATLLFALLAQPAVVRSTTVGRVRVTVPPSRSVARLS